MQYILRHITLTEVFNCNYVFIYEKVNECNKNNLHAVNLLLIDILLLYSYF